MLDVVNQIVYRVCPFVAAGCVIGAIYWTAVTYGALTVMQVVGTEEALTLMEQVCVHGISTGSRLTEKRNLSETLDRQLLLRTSSKLTYELKIIYFTWIYN